MALTDAKIRAAKPTDKAYKLTDGAGMFLLVHPNGSRYWRLRYRILGKEKTLALGVYPEVSLSEARTKRDEARKLISEGVDPCEQKRAKKVVPDLQLSFEHIARRWHASMATACWLSGTRCGVRILEPRYENFTPGRGSRSAGIVHMALSISISDQRAYLSSLERIKTSKFSITASRVTGWPL